MLASEVALKAIDILNARGWVRGRSHGPHGEVCLLQAVDDAAQGDDKFEYDLYDTVSDRLDELVPTHSAIDWNDEFAKGKRQVIALLRKAAKTFQKEGK